MIVVDASRLILSIPHQNITYPIKLSHKGFCCLNGSFGTPYGHHETAELIGDGADSRQIFVGRVPTQLYKIGDQLPLITTRIIRLRGIQPGINQGTNSQEHCVDTYKRYIYIHGVPEEMFDDPESGSLGCIILRPPDMIQLFNHVKTLSLRRPCPLHFIHYEHKIFHEECIV